MNRLLKVALALCATVTLTAVLMAADDQPAAGGGERGERGLRGERGGFFGAILGAGLDLTDEQRQKAEDVRKKAEAEYRAILTPEQQAKLDAFRSRRFDYEPDGDGDRDGVSNPERWVERAMGYDANKDGSLNKDELTKMVEAMAARREDRVERRDERGDRRDARDDRRDERDDRREDRRDGNQ